MLNRVHRFESIKKENFTKHVVVLIETDFVMLLYCGLQRTATMQLNLANSASSLWLVSMERTFTMAMKHSHSVS